MKSTILSFVWLGCLVGALPFSSVAWGAETLSLENPFLRFRLSSSDGSYEIEDKAAAVAWRSNPGSARLGEATLSIAGQTRRVALGRCDLRRLEDGLEATFHPLTERPDAALRVRVRVLAEPRTLEWSYEADAALGVQTVRLLDDGLGVTQKGGGYVVVPVREGLLIPADSGLAFTHRFDTFAYEGCHMEMFGVVNRGAVALVTWRDPYVALEIKSLLPVSGGSPEGQTLLPSLVLSKSARSFRIQFLGAGDYGTAARAYQQNAREKGWRVTWEEKLKGHPERAKLFGAINFKLWSALDRQMNEASTQEERVRLNWTFGEAAQIAEHLKNDLKLEKVLFMMGGWIRRGYDNQHPDILPAAPECGGNDALAECARRVRAMGYLFVLHDNYQDIYRDSPSWDENLIMKTAPGALAKGGHWAGGRAYLTCSQKAVELARRPQNLPAVLKLTGADAYFIDTTYAAGLMECFDPNHPLTRGDDMKWKQILSDDARNLFGIFGSECGREWAIPHSDFFEGLTGVSGRFYHDAGLLKKLGAAVVPLFEMVYRDGIALYGKYGYDPAQSAEYVLHHISLGRPLHYHEIPPHLYWKVAMTNRAEGPAAAFTRAGRGWAEGLHPLDRFVKNTYEILSPLNELTARMPLTQHQFLTPGRKVQRTRFGEGADAVEVVVNAEAREYEHATRWGGAVRLPESGFVVEAPTFLAFHALNWNGTSFAEPSLFVLRSLDQKPLDQSRKVRVFHGFGDDRIRWRGQLWTVPKEATIDPGE